MYPFYPCVYKPIPWRSVLARETDVRDAPRTGGSEGGALKGLQGDEERERERERKAAARRYTRCPKIISLPLKR